MGGYYCCFLRIFCRGLKREDCGFRGFWIGRALLVVDIEFFTKERTERIAPRQKSRDAFCLATIKRYEDDKVEGIQSVSRNTSREIFLGLGVSGVHTPTSSFSREAKAALANGNKPTSREKWADKFRQIANICREAI